MLSQSFFFDGMLSPNFGCLESQVGQMLIASDRNTPNSAHTYSTAIFASFETDQVIWCAKKKGDNCPWDLSLQKSWAGDCRTQYKLLENQR